MDTNQPPPDAPKDFDAEYDKNYGGSNRMRGEKEAGRKEGPSPHPDEDDYGLGTLERGARYSDGPDRRMHPTEEPATEESGEDEGT